MKNIKYILGIALILLFLGCEKYWSDHYDTKPETIDMNVWDAIQGESELSTFCQYITDYQYDTLFETNDVFSLFIPNNEAFQQMLDTSEMTSSILDYHISVHYIQSGNIKGKRKIQTFARKYAFGGTLVDSSCLAGESCLAQPAITKNSTITGIIFLKILSNVSFSITILCQW